jgi:hypothetical protein
MQNQNKIGRYYDYFPPFTGEPLNFLLISKNYEAFEAINDAWDDLFSARNEWRDKDEQDITESDVERWKAIYETYRKLVLEGLRDEYKQDFIDGKIV